MCVLLIYFVLLFKTGFKMEIGIGFWLGFIAFVAIMLCLDLFVFHKKDKEIGRAHV